MGADGRSGSRESLTDFARRLAETSASIVESLDAGGVSVIDQLTAGLRRMFDDVGDLPGAAWAFLCGYELGRRMPDACDVVYTTVGEYCRARL